MAAAWYNTEETSEVPMRNEWPLPSLPESLRPSLPTKAAGKCPLVDLYSLYWAETHVVA